MSVDRDRVECLYNGETWCLFCPRHTLWEGENDYSSRTKCIIAHDRHVNRKWPKVTWPKMDSLGRVRACATESWAISALMEPFHRKWRHPKGFPWKICERACTTGSVLGVLSRTFASYYHFLALSLVICPFPRHFIFTGSVISGQKVPLGRILRNFRLRMRAPFQGTHFGVMRNDTFCTTTIVRKKRGNRLRMRTQSLPWHPVLVKVSSGDVLPVRAASGHSTRNVVLSAPTGICLSKFSWKSTVTPKSLAFSSHVILFPFKSKDKLCLFVLGPMAIAWNLSGFVFIKFLE